MKPKVVLREWFKVGDRYVGICYGHPKHADGESVRTSRVVRELSVETANTVYMLKGPPAWMPIEPEE